jgi:predicted DNA-binding antitoxin AbrB/MazE fold protein
MSETIRGVYRNGVIEPAEPLKIAEGTEVYVTVQQKRSREELLSLLLKLKERGVIDFIPEGVGEPFPDIEPIKIKGGPMSDTIIEGRGPR